MMKLVKFWFVLMLLFAGSFAHASDADDATQAANDILEALHNKNFDDLWDNKMSAWYKKQLTRNSFMANMALGRSPLGNVVQPSTFVDMAYTKSDPSTGVTGEIYAFNFLTTYVVGRFYERIVVIKETDGIFRLTGLFGAPASVP
jgi:hypothetical protein